MPTTETPPPTILIVEDEPPIAHMLRDTLQAEGFSPLVAFTGEEGINFALSESPELVILDLMLPGIDGFEVVNRLRANARTAHIPVVILSARHDIRDKVRAFDSQVNDYLTKPFDSAELLARVRVRIRNAREGQLSPLTRLPSGQRVEDIIAQTLQAGVPWAILYLDLDHFKAYNDVYGPVRGNDLIRLLGRITEEAVRAAGNQQDVVGHIGGDDFMVITTPDRMQGICEQIMVQWDRESLPYYSPEDAQQGILIADDRQGQRQIYPLVGVSIGVVTSLYRPIATMDDFSRTVAEAKLRAKGVPGSSYYVDQRGPGPNGTFYPQ